MTFLGKGDALTKLGLLDEAEQMLTQAITVATDQGAWGYQGELTMMLAAIAVARKQPVNAERMLAQATEFARRAGGSRIVAQIALERGRLLRGQGRFADGSRALEEGITVARTMQERLLLPRLLTELAELRASQQRHGEAANLLEEANDLFEGFLATASSPWAQARIINGANDVFLARIRLEGARGPDPGCLFSIVEQARGRALLELLSATPAADVRAPSGLKAGERRLAALQVQLFQTKTGAERARLLGQIFVAEEQLAPLTTAFFDRTRRTTERRPITLRDVQRALRDDELFLEFALAEPRSYALVVTRVAARVQTLAGRAILAEQLKALVERIRGEQRIGDEARTLAAAMTDSVRELASHRRVIVSPDAELHHLPFELLPNPGGRRLLETHVVSYVPSGSVLTVLRDREMGGFASRTALAVSASPDGPAIPSNGSAVTRSVYDLDFKQLRALPAASDEARAVGALVGGAAATVLIGAAATEAAVKKQPLREYRVLHFAVHGIPSTRFPARSALLVQPADGEDGLLQAREILGLRLRAGLVTLSACDTGSGSLQEQEGVASLVRPFLAAGARSVVANLWAADDQFSLSLMREFYGALAAGADVGESLRRAKLQMLELFGPEVAAKLLSGLLVYGDSATTIANGSQTGL
jgi:CHAT domain-containing protein